LNQVLDFGIRPKCILGSELQWAHMLTLKDRLYSGQFDPQVVYHTPFCCMGWGIWQLSEKELAHAYGLPLASRAGLCFDHFSSFIPVQVMNAAWDCLVPCGTN
jgi:hypothetical protein